MLALQEDSLAHNNRYNLLGLALCCIGAEVVLHKRLCSASDRNVLVRGLPRGVALPPGLHNIFNSHKASSLTVLMPDRAHNHLPESQMRPPEPGDQSTPMLSKCTRAEGRVKHLTLCW